MSSFTYSSHLRHSIPPPFSSPCLSHSPPRPPPPISDTSVIFCFSGENQIFATVTPPAIDVPYLPPVTSSHGKQLLGEVTGDVRQAFVVHQMCALQMFQARMDRARHALRRRRALVAQKAVNLAGIAIHPLGWDEQGREYWRFPSSDDLYVREGGAEARDDPDRDSFKRLTITQGGSSGSSSASASASSSSSSYMDAQPSEHELGTSSSPSTSRLWQWKRISDITTIRNIVQLLGKSHSATEQDLRKQITQSLLSDTHSHGKSTSSTGGKVKGGKGLEPPSSSSSSSSGGGIKGEEEEGGQGTAVGVTFKEDPLNMVCSC